MEKASFGSNEDFTVGSTVRVCIPTNPKVKRRAIVATTQESSACVLFEQEAVVCQLDGNDDDTKGDTAAAAAAASAHCLLASITPAFQEDDSAEDVEVTVSLSELMRLLPFEIQTSHQGPPASTSISAWKERGDKLLQLGDGSAAIPYYVRGLKQSSMLQIGGSVVVKQGGHTKVADVDCFDTDDGSLDISMAESGEECSIKEKEVLLCLKEPDDEHIQERILLNLTRCYLQLSDPTSSFPASRRPKYLRAAVLATTLAMTVASFHSDDDDAMSLTHQTALILRAQAQASLSKFPHALQDVKRLLAANDQHREGRKLLRELEAKQTQKQKQDKQLVKEVCQWVETTTAAGGGDTDDGHVPVSNTSRSKHGSRSEAESARSTGATVTSREDTKSDQNRRAPVLPWLIAFLILIVALLIQSKGFL